MLARHVGVYEVSSVLVCILRTETVWKVQSDGFIPELMKFAA